MKNDKEQKEIIKAMGELLGKLEENQEKIDEEKYKETNKHINESLKETYKKPKKGFVVSAVLYPLLVLFLAILLGTLSMSDTRKRILDKMKLEIGDSLFDDGECTCETLSSKLDYLLQHGVGGGTSYSNNGMALSVTGYETFDNLPNVGNNIGNIAVITDTEISNYYLSSTVPKSPKNGTVWVVQDRNSEYYITSDYSKIGISYAMQYICDEDVCEWQIKKAYVYDEGKWNLLYYVPVSNGEIDLSGTDINAEIVHTYGYTGEYQTFTATFSGYYQVELWGAQGGSYSSGGGGLGSYTSGRVYLNAGETIYIYVGNQPSSVVGGWNGGGNGSSIAGGSAGGGGGATDVRLVSTSAKNLWDEFDSLKSRIMVAAGGGGGNYYSGSYYGQGGAGGGLIGYSGTINAGGASPGSGALQTYGGFSQYDTAAPDITKGSFGKGGQSQNTSWSTAGGGGGYYGGGGGSFAGGTGGGGSSYISGHEGCNSISEESTYNNLIFTGKSLNYNNYFFENTIMIDGQGYSWTNSKTSKINMPTHDGTSIMTGNSGNGYAKITLTDIMVISDSKLSQYREAKEKVWNFTYSNNYEEFEAKKTGIYQVELWGAQGGSYSSGGGGKGAYTYGKIYLTSGTKLYVYVGNQPIFTLGGYNGGGTGSSISSGLAGGGGGATDIRLISGLWNNFDSLKSRIMVAAGGGGGCYYSGSYYGQGGAGGGLNGYSGTINAGGASPGSGGMINIGGESNYDLAAITTTSGSFGIGGKSQSTSWSTAGGGGGYYGGGGGSYAGASGGGGSSYISGHAGCSTISDDSLSASIIHTGSAYHKSNYYFYDTEMIDGQGYNWTTYKLTSSGMPVVNSNTIQLGQSGNGYAKIMLLEEIDENPNVINDKYFSYEYNGKYQKFTASKTGIYQIELWGAEGTTYSGGAGGKGAYTSGEINLTSGTNLYIYVGSSEKGPKALNGGWNGGGSGSSISNGSSGGGGGATDVRITPTTGLTIWNNIDSLKSRIMVAAGGGGGCYYTSNYYGQGGGGGGLIGYSGTTNTGGSSSGTGGTQVGAGFSSYDGNAKSLTIGGLGYGGQSQHTSWSTAGGGGGYYGGGGGSYAGGAGGGGSSYISGHAGCIGTTSSGNLLTQTYSSLGDSINYTGYKFTNTLVIDGQGYPWSTVKSGSRSGMPSFNGILLQNGNTGNGYAKITYLGE